jgi:hypothetical protein
VFADLTLHGGVLLHQIAAMPHEQPQREKGFFERRLDEAETDDGRAVGRGKGDKSNYRPIVAAEFQLIGLPVNWTYPLFRLVPSTAPVPAIRTPKAVRSA